MTNSRHEKALDLAEGALGKMVKDNGASEAAGKMLAEADALDSTGPDEVLRDLNEDAAPRAHHAKPAPAPRHK